MSAKVHWITENGMNRKVGEVRVHIYFSDVFGVEPKVLDEYGALNISLINDLPLFVDPFLLFNSDDPTYRSLHDDVIKYLKFLREEAQSGSLADELVLDWFTFKEIKQNWLGFCKNSNGGRGLGREFAEALHKNLHNVFKNFGSEKLTKGTHLEKLCLIKDGVGRDNISDFATNLIKNYVCEYTQRFAQEHLHPSQYKKCAVPKAKFNYSTKTWSSLVYDLPYVNKDFVLLTPKNLLTKDDSWINRDELLARFTDVVDAVPNQRLRAQLNRYLVDRLDFDSKKSEREEVYSEAIEKFPEIIEYYILLKEEAGNQAGKVSRDRVEKALQLFVMQVKQFAALLYNESEFYETPTDTLRAARKRALFMKDVIENNDGYRIFYISGKPVQREEDLQILYRLTWYATVFDVNREVNNGRGPVDFKVSVGSQNKSLVEMKLASNKKLKQNLQKQVAIYESANETKKSIKIIIYFNDREKSKVTRVLKQLGFLGNENFILIDANRANKISASKAK
jgi:hypothetical protein